MGQCVMSQVGTTIQTTELGEVGGAADRQDHFLHQRPTMQLDIGRLIVPDREIDILYRTTGLATNKLEAQVEESLISAQGAARASLPR